jgi:hypothetical protein
VFDGELDGISAEKHIQGFEHFVDLFEIDHDDVCMRAFSQSLKGDTKDWFKHLYPETISSWEELKNVFLKFWGKKKSLDLQLTEFYALKRQSNETISIFSRRFSSIYYNFPKEIQPTEVVAMLHYTTTLHPNLSFLLMERRSESLQQMFNDAQEIQHNIQACEQIRDEELDAKETDNEYEQKTVNLNLEQKIDKSICPLEIFNANDSAKNYIPLVERGGVDLASNLSHDKQRADYFMYSFVDTQEDEFTNQFVEKQVDVPSLFLLDDTAYVVDLPVYDKYEDDCDVEDVLFRQYSDNYKEQSIGSAEENSLPLCFAAFKLLKENSEIIIEANKFVLMRNHTRPMKQIDEILQHSSHALDDPITCFVEDLVNSKVQSLVEDKAENEHVQQSKEIEKSTYDNSGENEEGFESGNKTLPLCFSSFRMLKQNVYSVSNQKASKHDVESEESNRTYK